MVEFLEWDSSFFGKQIFRVTVETASSAPAFFESILKTLAEKKADGAYFFLDKQDEAWMAKLETNGFSCIDKKVTFKKTIQRSGTFEDLDKIVEWSSGMNEQLLQLGLEAGKYSRFRLDKRIEGRFHELYATWMTNSVNGRIADAVLVSLNGKVIEGMLTYKINGDTATIGLIAAHPDLQGRGIGKKLLRYMELKLSDQMISAIEVSTQLANEQACGFYEKNGFFVKSVTPIFHVWIDQ